MSPPQAAAKVTGESGPPEPPFNLALVEEMLRLFARAVRAHQLYLHNNPTYLKALDSVRNAFPAIWEHTDELVLEVTDTQLRWEQHVVVNEPDKTSDALPWLLYKDGIRELTVLRGVEQGEILTLLQIVSRVRKASPDEDDLLTLLWEQEFGFVRYRYVDVSFESALPLDASEEAAKPKLVDSARTHEPPVEQVFPPGMVNLDDFATTLYFLDESEIEYIRGEIRSEYAADLRTNVVGALLDIFEQQVDEAVREEICTILDSLLVTLLASGQLRSVAYLLREVGITANRARSLSPPQRELILSLPSRMSEQGALSQLLQSLDERVDLPTQDELNDLFEELRVAALGTIFSWIGRVQTPRVRQLLETAGARLASQHTGELVRLIASGERDVMLEAVRRAGAMKAPAAVPALARVVLQEDAQVRLAAVQALADIGTAGALQQLERSLEDTERDVRVASVRAFAARAHRPALPRLEAAVKGKRLHEADLTEKMAFFEAFGALCGDPGVPFLDGCLNAKGLFGKREDPEVRACAAMALGRIGTTAALGALRKASTDKEVLVRNAVNRALRGGVGTP